MCYNAYINKLSQYTSQYKELISAWSAAYNEYSDLMNHVPVDPRVMLIGDEFEKLYCVYGKYKRTIQYDSNKTYISSFNMASHITSIPSNAKYMRLSQTTSFMNSLTLFKYGGGETFDTIVNHGQVSNADPNGSYHTVTFSDISSYEYVMIKVYDNVNGNDYIDYYMTSITKLGSGLSFRVALHTDVDLYITPTSIQATNYGGNWEDIYCDVIATSDDIFDIS